MNRNALKTTNQVKKERGENELAKNTKNMTQKSNPGGHEVVRATILAAKSWFLHRGKLRKGERENERGEGDGGSLILFNRSIT
jgi:hypothetical protein